MRNRTVAALLAFFAGGFGIHKFYLGQHGWGIAYLLFFWTMIPSLVAFFELIGFLVMSDQAFDEQYNRGHVTGTQHPPLGESSQAKVNTLMELKKLYDAGVITAEEYEIKRRKYLDSL